MSHYSDEREEYEVRQKQAAIKRKAIADAGLDYYILYEEYKKYQQALQHMAAVEYHQYIIDNYENNDKPKWEDFD